MLARLNFSLKLSRLLFLPFQIKIFENVTKITKKTKKTKDEIKKEPDECIINGEKNANKDIEEKSFKNMRMQQQWLKNLRIFLKASKKYLFV